VTLLFGRVLHRVFADPESCPSSQGSRTEWFGPLASIKRRVAELGRRRLVTLTGDIDRHVHEGAGANSSRREIMALVTHLESIPAALALRFPGQERLSEGNSAKAPSNCDGESVGASGPGAPSLPTGFVLHIVIQSLLWPERYQSDWTTRRTGRCGHSKPPVSAGPRPFEPRCSAKSGTDAAATS